MQTEMPYYEIRLPMPGQPDGYYTLLRAITPEGCAEVVRVLLDRANPPITELRIVRGVDLIVR